MEADPLVQRCGKCGAVFRATEANCPVCTSKSAEAGTARGGATVGRWVILILLAQAGGCLLGLVHGFMSSEGGRSFGPPTIVIGTLFFAGLIGNLRFSRVQTVIATAVLLMSCAVFIRATAPATDNIFLAAQHDDLRSARSIVERNPESVRGRDSSVYNSTPLHEARGKSVAEFLLAHGAAVDARNDLGLTPLHLAGPETAEVLLANHAEIDARDKHGQTPLHEKAVPFFADAKTVDDSRRAMEVLLAHHAAVDAKDDDGETPLHLASQGGQVEMVKLLLAHSADANARDNHGLTPLHKAAVPSRWHYDDDGRPVGGNPPSPDRSQRVTEVLLENHAAVNAPDDNKETPLHLAAGACQELVVPESGVKESSGTVSGALLTAGRSTFWIPTLT